MILQFLENVIFTLIDINKFDFYILVFLGLLNESHLMQGFSNDSSASV